MMPKILEGEGQTRAGAVARLCDNVPGDPEEGYELAQRTVPRHRGVVGGLGWLDLDELGGRLVGPGREGLRRAIGGGGVGEVIRGRTRRGEIRVGVVGDEGIGELEHDIHGGRRGKRSATRCSGAGEGTAAQPRGRRLAGVAAQATSK